MTVTTEPIDAWWFANDSGVLPHGDGRSIILGKCCGVTGKLVICQNGLHGSRRPLDALQYAPGPIVYRTQHSGTVIEQTDKLCSRYRIHIDRRDATAVLRLFARQCALSVIHLWDAPAVVRQYLETGDEHLRVAARAAAWDAARDAARDAVWATAWATARDAVWVTAWYAARDAARDAQNQMLTDLLVDLFATPEE